MKKTIPLPSEHLVLVKERKLFDLPLSFFLDM
jgi:hypothetical protein